MKYEENKSINSIFCSYEMISELRKGFGCGIIYKSSGNDDGVRLNMTGCSAVW